MAKRNLDYEPHLHLRALKGEDGEFVFINGEKQWECVNCGLKGGDSMMHERNHPDFKECTCISQPCKYCGEHPLCSKDCLGVLSILGEAQVNQAVYVAEESPCGYTECQNCHKQTTDLRMGVCFDCVDFIRTDEKFAWAIDDPEKKWPVMNPSKVN